MSHYWGAVPNFMFILLNILNSCPEHGEDFLIEAYLKPNFEYFKFSYQFNERGEIISEEPRHYTDRNQNETDRYKRIAINSVYDYSEKDNRHNNNDLTTVEKNKLVSICRLIESGISILEGKKLVSELIESIENRLINNL